MKNSHKIITLLSIIGLFVTFAFTQIDSKTVKSSSISFVIKNLGLNVDGTLSNLTVTTFNFDEDSLSKSVIEATVDLSTISTGIAKRDDHLKQEEYFDMAKYPKISLKSVRFAKSVKGNVIGYFKLTMKGVSKEVGMPIYVEKKIDGTEFKAEFEVNRLDYGIGTSSNVLSDNAKITIFVKTN